MNKFSLRQVENTDHEWLVELHNDPLVLKNNTDPCPITLESHLKWWASLNPTREKRQIFCVDGERVGFAKISAIDEANSNCLLGGDIHTDFRGRGYAKPMWRLMLHQCFWNLRLYRVGLTVAEYNSVGQHIYTSLGFKEEGRLKKSLRRDGKFYDQIMMYMTFDEWQP